jgi:hypothetical protein
MTNGSGGNSAAAFTEDGGALQRAIDEIRADPRIRAAVESQPGTAIRIGASRAKAGALHEGQRRPAWMARMVKAVPGSDHPVHGVAVHGLAGKSLHGIEDGRGAVTRFLDQVLSAQTFPDKALLLSLILSGLMFGAHVSYVYTRADKQITVVRSSVTNPPLTR